MKTLLITVFVSVIAFTLPVKIELFRLSTYGNCTIYKEINEFNDELKGYHFTYSFEGTVITVPHRNPVITSKAVSATLQPYIQDNGRISDASNADRI